MRILQCISLAFILVVSSCNMVKHLYYLNKAEANKTNFYAEIPFVERYGLIVIKAGINGSKKKYEFIFDTGATMSIISKELVEKYGIEKCYSYSIRDSHNNTSKHDHVLIDHLGAGGIHFNRVLAGVVTYPEESGIRCIAANGIIGANIMNGYYWKIDYQENKIIVSDDISNFPGFNNSTKVKMRRNSPSASPIMNLSLDGKKIKNVLLDCGSNRGFYLPEKYLHDTCKRITYINGSSQGLHGRVNKPDSAFVAKNNTVTIGSKTFKGLHITFNRLKKKHIGNEIFKHFDMLYDFKNRYVYFDQVKDLDSCDIPQGYGFVPIMERDSVYVATIFMNSKAANSGLEIGDKIESINGKNISNYCDDYCDFFFWRRNFLKEKKSITLKLQNKDGNIHLTPENFSPIYNSLQIKY